MVMSAGKQTKYTSAGLLQRVNHKRVYHLGGPQWLRCCPRLPSAGNRVGSTGERLSSTPVTSAAAQTGFEF